MFKKVRSWVQSNHYAMHFLHHTDNVAHVGYLGAAGLGMHELYGWMALVVLAVFVANLVVNGGEA